MTKYRPRVTLSGAIYMGPNDDIQFEKRGDICICCTLQMDIKFLKYCGRLRTQCYTNGGEKKIDTVNSYGKHVDDCTGYY